MIEISIIGLAFYTFGIFAIGAAIGGSYHCLFRKGEMQCIKNNFNTNSLLDIFNFLRKRE